MLQSSFADRRCPHYKRAIRDCRRDAAELFCSSQNFRGIHRRPRLIKRHSILIHHAQMRETKIVHCPRNRADIVRIARPHQDHTDTVELLPAQHALIILGANRHHA